MNDKQESHENDGKHGNDESHNSPSSHKSHPDQNQRPIIPPRGDYQTLLSYQKAEVVYDITFRFAHKFLSKGDLTIWDKDSKEALFVRDLGRRTPQTFEMYREFVETRPAEVLANIAICLIHQTNYLLDQQLKTLEKEFVEQGGLRERMTKARLNYRNQRRKQ